MTKPKEVQTKDPVSVREVIKNKKPPKKTKKKQTKPKIKDFTFKGSDGEEYTLNEQQKKFCDLYLQYGASGVDAYIDAGYKVSNKRVAAANASRLLTNANIINYINTKYEEAGFNDDDVLKEHLFIIKQHADLRVKAKGIEMYYKKKSKGFGPSAPDSTPINALSIPDEKRQQVLEVFAVAIRKVYGPKPDKPRGSGDIIST